VYRSLVPVEVFHMLLTRPSTTVTSTWCGLLTSTTKPGSLLRSSGGFGLARASRVG
jgi:hypothetical protein